MTKYLVPYLVYKTYEGLSATRSSSCDTKYFMRIMTEDTPLLLDWNPWSSSVGMKSTMEMKPPGVSYYYKCTCGVLGRFFNRFAEKLDKSNSLKEFSPRIVSLVRHIWVASDAQRMTPCILEAIHECIAACKQTKFPIGPVVELYDFRMDGKTLPTWIILHSPSDDHDLAEVRIRHLLLQIYLDELPLTPAIRDELYLACAVTGFNNFFAQVRQASLKQLQTPPATHLPYMEKGPYSLKLPSETVAVVSTICGFRLKWYVPEMLRKLQLGHVIGVEFVAKGHVWGLYIQTQGRYRPWRIVLCALKPSQINLEGTNVVVSFRISRYRRRNILNWGSAVFVLRSGYIQTLDLPLKNKMPDTQSCWLFSSTLADKCYKCVNKDGSCYLMLAVVAATNLNNNHNNLEGDYEI